MKVVSYILIQLFCCFFLISLSYADNLGRLFTSVSERNKLEILRKDKEETKVDKIEKVEIIEIPEPGVVQKEIIVRDRINLKGLVHRSDGKNTAWINDSNTFEGDLESQYIQIPDKKIKSDKVTIIMPDDSTNVELKVGESYDPQPIEKDIVEVIEADEES